MTEVTPHPLKTQGFHHFFILLFYDHPANDVTIMKEGHPEAGTPLFWWVRLELNQRCFRCHGFTDRLLQPFAYRRLWREAGEASVLLCQYYSIWTWANLHYF